jgi:hypothetical protein
MAKDYEITCINKPNRSSLHEHITHVGNVAGNWRMSREDVIKLIDGKTATFYTIDYSTAARKRAEVGVVRGDGNKAPYLRTYADGKWNDNLLAQQECGANCKIV